MRRYSVLFVDDEELIRESLMRLVDWKKQKFDIVGIFKDGEDAWRYLTMHPVDIIITDINMPFMDGISLLELIRKEKMKTRVPFLTGYEYFEYAQKAIQLKAFDFLLKPLTTEKLLNALEHAALDIEQEETREEAVEKSMELSKSTFVNQLFYGHIDKEHIKKEAEKVGIPGNAGSYLAMMAVIDVLDGKTVSESELLEWKTWLKSRIVTKGQKQREGCPKTCAFYFGRNANRNLPFLIVSAEKEFFSPECVRALAEDLLELEKEVTRYRVTFVVGRAHRMMEHIPESFGRVLHAADNRHILRGKGWKLIYASDSIPEQKKIEKIVLPTDTFLHHIRMGMTDEVERDIREIYGPFRHKEYISLASAKMVTTELAITAFKGEITSRDESVSYLYYLNHIQQLNTLDELEEDILQFATGIAERRRKGGSHKKQTAEQALEYLKLNYSKEDLSLNDVAGFLNISVPYLAVLFKQETKQNFSAHLLEIRMEKAKELLRTSGKTIGEIAELVGYSSPQYFAVCFKKYTGISPGTYREQL